MPRRAAKIDTTHRAIADHLSPPNGRRMGVISAACLEAARNANSARRKYKDCAICGTPFFIKSKIAQDSRKTCSKACMAKLFQTTMFGSGNGNWRYAENCKCESCGKPFKTYHHKTRRFCSVECTHIYQLAHGRVQREMRLAAKLDENHEEIVTALKNAGVSVLSAVSLGNGFPDLICATKKKTALIEIKNPKSQYGKKGLNPLQAAFARQWRGNLYIAYTARDALLAMDVVTPEDGELPPPDYGWGDYVARDPEAAAEETKRNTARIFGGDGGDGEPS